MTVNEMIAEHEAHARMFDQSAVTLAKAGMPSSAEAGRRIAQQHRSLAEVLRTAMQQQRELRTAEALRKRGSV